MKEEPKEDYEKFLFCFIIILSLFVCCSGTNEDSVQRTIKIPGDFTSIQQGVDIAENGDIVLISPGTYNEYIRISGKAITIASLFYTTGEQEYIEETIIDGGGPNVIEVGSGGGGTEIIGLTIQNGLDGIRVNSSVNISHNRIINNGDGIDYEGGGGLCSDNYFAGNSDDGIDLDGPSAVTISSNEIRDNDDDGIEIRLHEYSGSTLNIEISNNFIYNNQEDGVQLIDYPDVSDRIFRIEKNLFVDNAMAAVGFMDNGNTLEDYSGAALPERVFLINNTFAGNNYGIAGGANLIALNNVFTDTQFSALKKVSGDSIASYNLFWNNGTDYEDSSVQVGTTVFANPLLDSDYYLSDGSPAIDSGTDFFEWQGETVLEISGTQYSGSAPDMGAFEY